MENSKILLRRAQIDSPEYKRQLTNGQWVAKFPLYDQNGGRSLCSFRDVWANRGVYNLKNGVFINQRSNRDYLINSGYTEILDEVIFYLENHDFWNQLLNSTGYRMDKKTQNKKYVMLDAYDPYRKVAIETDSIKYHSSNPVKVAEDKMRDKYLEKIYGVKTVRIMQTQDADRKAAEKILDETEILDSPYFPPMPEVYFHRYLSKRYKKELKILLDCVNLEFPKGFPEVFSEHQKLLKLHIPYYTTRTKKLLELCTLLNITLLTRY